MDVEPVRILFRWFHIGPVIVALGGAVFMRFALSPAVGEALDEAQRARLQTALMRRWKRVTHVCITLILISGLYNIAVVAADKPGAYLVLFGLKLVAALGVFFLASALVGSSPAFAALRADARRWLGVVVFLGLTIVLISGFLKFVPDKQGTVVGDPAAVRAAQKD